MVSTSTGTSTNSSAQVSNAGQTDTSIPVIQSVSSLAGAGMPSARPDQLPTHPVPPSQLSHQPQQPQQPPHVCPPPPPPPPPQIITRTNTETMVRNLYYRSSLVLCEFHYCDFSKLFRNIWLMRCLG